MVERLLKMIYCVPNGIQSQGKKNPPKKGGNYATPDREEVLSGAKGGGAMSGSRI
jgi:hypothetical protein